MLNIKKKNKDEPGPWIMTKTTAHFEDASQDRYAILFDTRPNRGDRAERLGKDPDADHIQFIRQPTNDLTTLKADAVHAQAVLNSVGQFLLNRLGGVDFIPRPAPKDDARIREKATKFETETRRVRTAAGAPAPIGYGCVRDLAAGFITIPIDRVRPMLDMLCGNNDESDRLRTELKQFGVVALDEVENNFSKATPSNMRNLNMKVALEIPGRNGNTTYHVCEIQVFDEDGFKQYNKTHAPYELVRSAEARLKKLGEEEKRITRHMESQQTIHTLEKLHERMAAITMERPLIEGVLLDAQIQRESLWKETGTSPEDQAYAIAMAQLDGYAPKGSLPYIKRMAESPDFLALPAQKHIYTPQHGGAYPT